MDEKYIIQRSLKPVELQMAAIFVVGLFLFIFTSQIFRAFDSVVSIDTSGLTSLARILVFVCIVFGLVTAWVNGRKASYYATKDSIAIMRGAFGAKSKKVYGVDHITGLGLDQSMFGARMNYGNIDIDLSALSSTERIRLTNVENPEEVLRQLRTILKK